MCRESFRYGRRVPANTVHHIFPRKEFPEYAFSDWNLISLCSTVHDHLHDRNTNELTAKGRDLLRRTARKYGIEIPDKYKE